MWKVSIEIDGKKQYKDQHCYHLSDDHKLPKEKVDYKYAEDIRHIWQCNIILIYLDRQNIYEINYKMNRTGNIRS